MNLFLVEALKRKTIVVPSWVEHHFSSIGKNKRYPHGNFSRGLRIVAHRDSKIDYQTGRKPKS